jgi:hypothetical protein
VRRGAVASLVTLGPTVAAPATSRVWSLVSRLSVRRVRVACLSLAGLVLVLVGYTALVSSSGPSEHLVTVTSALVDCEQQPASHMLAPVSAAADGKSSSDAKSGVTPANSAGDDEREDTVDRLAVRAPGSAAAVSADVKKALDFINNKLAKWHTDRTDEAVRDSARAGCSCPVLFC